jgi:hypothetical protein
MCSSSCWDRHSKFNCPFKALPRPQVRVYGPDCVNECFWSVISAGGVPEQTDLNSVLANKLPLEVFCPRVNSWTGLIGTRQVRSNKHPLGLPGVFPDTSKIRCENKLGHLMADAISGQLEAGGHFIFVHPCSSFIWCLYDFVALQTRSGVVFSHFTVMLEGWPMPWCLFHNVPGLEPFFSDVCFIAVSGDHGWLPFGFFKALSLAVSASLGSWSKLQLPAGHQDQRTWVLDALRHSTKGLAKPGVAFHAAKAVLGLMSTMHPGREENHLTGLLDLVDFRGSDVRLDTGAILEGSRQPIPYPAICWDWSVVQSYAWKQTQHINVLELLAFFNYFRSLASFSVLHSQRILHVLDSRVCSCVLSKGRSSSKLLNRVLRRILGVSLAADLYVLPLWTISAWNFADAGSRTFCPGDLT